MVLWNRLNLQTRFLRTLFLGGLFVLTGFPGFLGFSSGGIRINFPPYLPISRDASFASEIIAGEYKDWAALVLGGPQAVPSFPLRIPLGLAQNQCLYFSDRIRWGQEVEKPSDAKEDRIGARSRATGIARLKKMNADTPVITEIG
jgi:hypothetical protein